MNTSKKFLVAGMTIVTMTSAGLFLNSAIAKGGNDLTGLASTLATQYHLNQTQVKVTLDEFRSQKLAEREAEIAKGLDQAVTDGALTQDQREKILAKRSEVKTKLNEIRTITSASDRQTARQQLRQDLKQWAKDNSIPLRWLRASRYAGMAAQ